MRTESLSLRIFRLVLNLCWWGSIILASLTILAMAAALGFDEPDSEWGFHYTGYSSDIVVEGVTATDKRGELGEVGFEIPTMVKIHYPVATKGAKLKMTLLVLAAIVAAFTVIMLVLKKLREILNTVEAGDPFVSENAKRVRLIGVLILVSAIAKFVLMLLATEYAYSSLITTGFTLERHADVDWVQLMTGLCVIALSEVFRHGTKMREEQELTV